jgi:hypothetical protein
MTVCEGAKTCPSIAWRPLGMMFHVVGAAADPVLARAGCAGRGCRIGAQDYPRSAAPSPLSSCLRVTSMPPDAGHAAPSPHAPSALDTDAVRWTAYFLALVPPTAAEAAGADETRRRLEPAIGGEVDAAQLRRTIDAQVDAAEEIGRCLRCVERLVAL